MLLTENCIFSEMAKKDQILQVPSIIHSLSPNCNKFFKTVPKSGNDYLSKSRELISAKNERKEHNITKSNKFEFYRKNMDDFVMLCSLRSFLALINSRDLDK